MTVTDMFTRALRAWDVTIEDVEGTDVRKRLRHVPSGKILKVHWSPVVASDLVAYHGPVAIHELATALLSEVMRELAGAPNA